MKRRSFIKLLAGATIAITTGVCAALPEPTKPQIAVAPKPKHGEINPAWLNAPYEAWFCFDHRVFENYLDPYPLRHEIDNDPPRFKLLDGSYKIVS